MKKRTTINLIAVGGHMTVIFGTEQFILQQEQNPSLFKKLLNLASANKLDEIGKEYFNVKAAVEKYTKQHFTVEHSQLKLKATGEVIPEVIAKKLLELKKNDEDFMPLVRFWKKLSKNPDPRIKEQLFGFLRHNNIPLTEDGDVLAEKGVEVLPDGTLVDCHTKKIDNSIGMVVSMPREDCDSDPNVTCSCGLHVAAPDYVRHHWSSGVIIEVIIDPQDFVAVPIDYNNTKARVCRYKVIGIAKKSPRQEIITKWEDIISIPTYGALSKQQNVSKHLRRDTSTGDYSEFDFNEVDFSKMTASNIKEYIKTTYGLSILNQNGVEMNNKNKKGIVAAAKRIVQERSKQKPVDFSKAKAKDIVAQVEKDFNKHLGGTLPRRARVLAQAKKLYEAKGIKVIG